MTPKLMVRGDAAEYCGTSTDYLMNQARHGKVGYVQPSPRKIMFRQTDLDKWIAGWRTIEVNDCIAGSRSNGD
jgi:hypothetical protein